MRQMAELEDVATGLRGYPAVPFTAACICIVTVVGLRVAGFRAVALLTPIMHSKA